MTLALTMLPCAEQVPPPSLGTDMAQLLESGTAADVKFKVEEEDLPAHKFILTARSPVFRSATIDLSADSTMKAGRVLSSHVAVNQQSESAVAYMYAWYMHEASHPTA